MMNNKLGRIAGYSLIAGLGLSLLTACGGSSSNGSAKSSTASFSVTDAPVDDIDAVKITFSRIDLKPANGDIVSLTFDEPVVIDNLLDLTGNAASPIISDAVVPAGDYQWLRIFVTGGFPDSTVLPKLGNETDLFIPGQQNGNANNNGTPRSLKLNTGFTVPTGGNADFTIDFVLRKGLTKPANSDHYLLRPAMRLVNNVEVGTISGTVDNTVIASNACGPTGISVYLYEGDLNANSQVPDDIYDPNINADIDEVSDDVSGQRPISSAEVSMNDSSVYTFEIGFVRATEAGYSLALTCQSSLDDAASDDDINFIEVLPVVVTANQTSELSFTQPL
ncbi:DUF4382 domain-containing protein [Zhongshania guokunii]|uniref:DUF4382 domain-containing protein n=1 Tax=Zhongshania guokunii TaxID=641783 RepID=A0ABV3U954_9GAMM